MDAEDHARGEDEEDAAIGGDLLWLIGWIGLISFSLGALGWCVAAYLSQDWYMFEVQKVCRHMIEKGGRPTCYIQRWR